MPVMWMDVDTALSEVPINVVPLTDDSDFKTREESVVYNQAGLDLVWNFVTTAGAYTQTAVTPTESAGNYDWSNQGNGMYAIEIPASGGASINNDTEGFGWFSGVATGILPWSGPIIGFRAAGLNNLLIDDAYSATRGLAGTALPAAAADAAGGLPISDAGGLDLDAILADTNELQADWVNGGRLDLIVDSILADTNELQTDWVNGGRLDLIIDAILADTGTDGVLIATGQTVAALTITSLTVTNNAIGWNASWDAEVQSEVADGLTAFGWSSITIGTATNLTNAPTSGDLTATMKASVNSEVVDALNVDTYAEPGQGAPAATLSLAAKIGYLFKAFRNKKTQTASQYSLYADDATTIDQKATVSDDGTTTTMGEVATGP